MRAVVVNLPDESGQNIIKDLYNGAWCRGARISNALMPPLGLLYAYTVLRQAGWRVRLIDAVYHSLTIEKLLISVEDQDLIVAHTSAYTFSFDRQVLMRLREHLPDCTIFVFGNLQPQQASSLIDAGQADHVCTSDPEWVLMTLANSTSLKEPLAGVYHRQAMNIEKAPLQDLDTLPIPDRRPILGYRYPNLLAKTENWTNALASRGCRYACTFCNTPGYYERSYRRHSTARVMEELEYLVDLGYREIFFRDDLFFAGNIPELCEAILQRGLILGWVCNQRVETLDEKTLALMARAGCHTIKFGVESGSDEVLSRIGKAGKQHARQTFTHCRRLGIRTHAHLMIGLPGETREQVRQTLAFLDELDPYTFTLGLFTPHPGSELYEQLQADGMLPSGIFKEALHNNPSCLEDRELQWTLQRAYLTRYLDPSRWSRYLQGRHRPSALVVAGLRLVANAVRSRS